MKKIIFILFILPIVCFSQVRVDLDYIRQVSVNESENSIFTSLNNPNFIVNANNYWTSLGALHVNFNVSTNGGNNWINYSDPFNGQSSHSDPSVTIDNRGNIYVNYLSNVTCESVLKNLQQVSVSTNNGTNWTHSGPLNSCYKTDKNYIYADNSCISVYEGHVYVFWQELSAGSTTAKKVFMSKTTNAGINWSSEQVISDGSSIPGLSILGLNFQGDKFGNLYGAWFHYPTYTSFDRIYFMKSSNGGTNWSEADVKISGLNGKRNFGMGPSLAVNYDNSDLYMVWAADDGGSSENSNVYFAKSTNAGDNWSSKRIPLESGISGNQWFPWITYDALSGYLFCVYYDNRTSGVYNTYVAYSSDFGASWDEILVSNSNSTAPSGNNDYIGITSSQGYIYPVWSQFNGTFATTYSARLSIKDTYVPTDLVIDSKVSGTDTKIAKNSILTENSALFESGSNINLKAGNVITLAHDTHIEDGAYFHAFINNCIRTAADNFVDVQNVIMSNMPSKDLSDKNEDRKDIVENAYPNPFNPQCVIKFNLKQDEIMTALLYDISGRLVAKIYDNVKFNSGENSFTIKSSTFGLSSGVYFLKLNTNNFSKTLKLVLAK